MSKVIKVLSKEQRKNFKENNITTVFALALFEDSKICDATFYQTDTLTQALAGMTEYGALFMNPNVSDYNLTVELKAVASDGEEVVVSTTLSALASKPAGGTIS